MSSHVCMALDLFCIACDQSNTGASCGTTHTTTIPQSGRTYAVPLTPCANATAPLVRGRSTLTSAARARGMPTCSTTTSAAVRPIALVEPPHSPAPRALMKDTPIACTTILVIMTHVHFLPSPTIVATAIPTTPTMPIAPPVGMAADEEVVLVPSLFASRFAMGKIAHKGLSHHLLGTGRTDSYVCCKSLTDRRLACSLPCSLA